MQISLFFGYKNPLSEGQTLENADTVIENFFELKEYI